MATKPKKFDDGYNLSLVVSKKGAVQINGLRRFPVTLYQDEMEAVLSRADAIRKFIKDNQKHLKSKGESDDESRPGTAI